MTASTELTVPERIAARRTLVFLALVGACGQFAGYANPFGQFPPAALLLPAVVFASASLSWGKWPSFYTGWLAGTLGMGLSLYWLSVPVHDFGGMPWPVAALCVVAVAGYLGLFTGLFSLACCTLRRLPLPLACVAAGLAWGGLEWLRGWLFTGFPWVSLSTAFAPWPVWIQGASLFGAYGLSALLAACACLICGAYPLRTAALRPGRRGRMACLALAALLLAGLWAWGAYRLGLDTSASRSISVAMVQGNVNQDQKWEARYQKATVERYIGLSDAAVDPALGKVKRPVDLVIWPETAMPFYFEEYQELADMLRGWTGRWAVPLVFGAPGKSWSGETPAWHNRVWLLNPDGSTSHHDKVHLVPFGEYVPLNLPLPFVDYFLEGMDFSPGDAGKLIHPAGVPAGVLVCYEAIFPELARDLTKSGARIFINVSNDAWFGRTAAPMQHLYLTAMRAVEADRHILRATNTGYTAHIDNRGRVVTAAPWFRPLTLMDDAATVDRQSFYHRYYTVITACLALLPLLFLAAAWKRSGRK